MIVAGILKGNLFSDLRFKDHFCLFFLLSGDDVSMIGYGVFGREHELLPTMTRGIVAKTVDINDQQVMIQVHVLSSYRDIEVK